MPSKRQIAKNRKRADRLSVRMQAVAASTWRPGDKRKANQTRVGSLGAAGPVRRIDPATGLVIEVLSAEGNHSPTLGPRV